MRGQRRGHVIGLARNSRLVEKIGWELADAQAEAKRRGRPARRFAEFPYATLTSWSRKRRVVAKAEHLPGKSNPRFVVTSLPDTFSARTVYERVYCPRGNMENAIKEQQLDLFSDRTSASRFAANQLRLLFSAFASILFVALRRALHGTRLARATAGTLRLKLLKIGASRHGLGAKGQGRHGLRTPVGRRLRTRPRPIARVDSTPPSSTRSSRSSGDHCAAGPKKLAQAAVLAPLAPQNTAAEPLAHAPPAPSAETRPQRCPQSPQR